MKKTLLLLLVAMSVSLSSFAQKGRQAVGVDLPFRTSDFSYENTSYGIGLKYQYNINDYIRIEPIFQYFLQDRSDEFNLIGAINSHVFFFSPSRFRQYFLFGIGYAEGRRHVWNIHRMIYRFNGFWFQSGIGFDYRISYDWSWQMDIGMHGHPRHGHDTMGFCLSTGITYNF